MAPILGYWKLRGLAHPIRFLLEFAGSDYEEKIYEFGSKQGEEALNWMADKFSLGLDFPNLPYYIDGEVKLTQSNAILYYIAAKTKLDGKTKEEKGKVAMLACEAFDMRMAFARLCYADNFESLKDKYISETLPNKLQQLSDFLGTQNWFVNDVTYVDFLIYEVLFVHQALSPPCLSKFENLKTFMSRVESLPSIKKYMESSRFIKYPINGMSAKFGGK